MLQPDASQPGRWMNPNWQPGNPGTFAVIIGASEYAHLDGGSAPAPDTYDLGQLYVSALTAHRFFCWLKEQYQYDGSPLAQCWLLLSPSKPESEAVQTITHHLLPPTFNHCEAAIQECFAAMQQLPLPSAQKSRFFFFFSGHGLELTQQKQILLPCDYLKPPAHVLNKAISTENLFDGLAELKVPEQFFFVDACRNDHPRLKGEIAGSPILDVPPSRSTNPDRNAPLFYASASGTQAWQPLTPAEGPSLFGKALLEGLEAQANLEIDRKVQPFLVQIAPLQKYTRRRVLQLLEERRASVSQSVMFGGVNSDLFATVTQVFPPYTTQSFTPSPEIASFPVRASHNYSPPRELYGWHPQRQGLRLTFNHEIIDLHDVFGSEQVTDLWQTVRIYSFRRQTWLAAGEDYAVRRISRADTRSYRIEFVLLHNDGSHWLEISDRETTFACLLPSDQSNGIPTTPLYLLELDFNGDRLIRLNASLSPDNAGLLGEMAKIWEKYGDGSIAEAVEDLDASKAELALFEKLESPLGATIASIILLRSRRLDLLHTWLRNLANWFPDKPDAPVLWAEQLRLQSANVPTAEIIDYVLKLRDRGLPQTAEAFGYAVSQVEALLQFQNLQHLNPFQQSELEALQLQFRQALPLFRTGGLFSTFAGKPGELSPALIMSRHE